MNKDNMTSRASESLDEGNQAREEISTQPSSFSGADTKTEEIETGAEKRWAVVTGASSGIGYHLAELLGERGFSLLLNSSTEKIIEAQDKLVNRGFDVDAIEADLSEFEGVEKLWEAIEALPGVVEVVALNAGVGTGGDFATETSLEKELEIIDLNVVASVYLAKRVLPRMVEQGRGRLLFTSSIAGTMPTPLEAVYGASKAFLLSFSQALHHELKDKGIAVTALLPGPTNTNFFERAGMQDTQVGTEGKYTNDPREVAKQGLDALFDGDDHVFASSAKTKLQGELGKFIPDEMMAKQHKKMAAKKS
jgi:short-subunit dehydrogenase